ncbi:hypothetical protein CMI40_00475 [Candidatus Pacearchaeota archaeon]|jgi:hypothetical protein|nr:hypothetical protein [Candidatus Pacearchaeota archaeon]|tara:strand:- start:14795 stop:15184 length:390 start_codon:yes stop_codon:yes gene_type:complete
MKKEWIREIARDIIALGSIPFLILVLVRVLLIEKPFYFYQFLIAGIIFLVFMIIFKYNLYAGLGLIILVFTNLYYDELRFTVFSILVYIGLISSLFYLKEEKYKIIKGILFGVISSGISYLFVKYFFQL